MIRSLPYRDYLLETLGDPSQAAAYLNAAMEENNPELLLMALRNVAEAHGGIGVLSAAAGVNRQHVYRVLAKDGNPRLSTLASLLAAAGLKLTVDVASRGAGKRGQGRTRPSPTPGRRRGASVARRA
jgi:probable addiction module antidote protein